MTLLSGYWEFIASQQWIERQVGSSGGHYEHLQGEWYAEREADFIVYRGYSNYLVLSSGIMSSHVWSQSSLWKPPTSISRRIP